MYRRKFLGVAVVAAMGCSEGTGDEQPTSTTSGQIEVVSIAIGEETVTIGTDLQVEATLENTGDATMTETYEIMLNGIGTQDDITLEPGERETVSTTIPTTTFDAGSHEITARVDGNTATRSVKLEEVIQVPEQHIQNLKENLQGFSEFQAVKIERGTDGLYIRYVSPTKRQDLVDFQIAFVITTFLGEISENGMDPVGLRAIHILPNREPYLGWELKLEWAEKYARGVYSKEQVAQLVEGTVRPPD